MSQQHEPRFLGLFRCPITGQRLRPALPEEVARLEAAGASPLAWLANEEATFFYPVQEGIPLLLAESARRLG